MGRLMNVVSWVLVVVLLGGCATQTQTGAAVGAGTGIGIGAIIGGALGGQRGALFGATVGGAVGAGVGALIGNHLDRQVATRAEAARQVRYSARQGTRVEIQRSDLAPLPTQAGATVVSRVEYAVLAPDPSTIVDLNEARYIQRDGQTVIGPIQRQVSRTQGVHQSEYHFTVPDGTPAGQYTMLTVLEANGASGLQRRTVQSAMTVR